MDPKKKVYVDEIRKIHKDLRRKYRKGQDFTQLWNDHCDDEETLGKYAESMQDLATEIWDEDCDGTHRIQWCVDTCKCYFLNGELKKLLEKDKRRMIHYLKDPTEFHCGPKPCEKFSEEEDASKRCSAEGDVKLSLLDVGSCYDPFRKYNDFETTAIDLKPACENVFKCDFLNVKVTSDPESMQHLSAPPSSGDKRTSCSVKSGILHTLPLYFFDVVVLSLVLTYIPCPHTRWKMCDQAHKVLKADGLLLIVTPDSSHQNKNAFLMKRWKSSIEGIGFQRIKYSKDRHLHFLAFRKVPNGFLWDRRKIEENENQEKILNIPQDFQESSEEDEDDEKLLASDDLILENFSELPQISD